jgi:leucyl-tRNA synthetase
LKNTMQEYRRGSPAVLHSPAWQEAVHTLLLLMAPFTPHIAEELWERIGGEYSIHVQPWPVADLAAAQEDLITLVVQVNGKIRDRIEVPADITEAQAREQALASEKIQAYLNNRAPHKVIYAEGRLINIVV